MAQPALEWHLAHGDEVVDVLGQAALAIHAESEPDRVKRWATEAARVVARANAAQLCLIDAGDLARCVSSSAGNPATSEALATLGDPRRHHELLPAVRGGSAVRIDDVRQDAWGRLASSLPGVASLMAVPVLTVDGMTQGVMVVCHSDPLRFSDSDQDAIAALVSHLGVALDNLANRRALERLRATDREVVNQLQAAVMPAQPEVPYTELGLYYSPADPGVHTGGDLYDWIVLPNGDLHLAVVDVMGKGVSATKDALAVTHALRLLAIDGCALVNLASRANDIVTAQNPDLVATVMTGRYRPSTGMLSLAGAGHPPAMLVTRGKVTRIAAPGVPLGWPGAGSDIAVDVQLGRSDTIIFYTDGLIEGGKDIVRGLESLERFGRETARYPAAQQARILVERALRGASRRDDTLALILRRRNPATKSTALPLGPFEYRLSRSTAAVSVSRSLLKEWLTRVPVEAEAAHELLLVATELCANAVNHASWTGAGVVLRARVEGPDVILEVEDDGRGVSWPYFESEPPDPEAERGRGLWLVRTFTDEATPEVVDGRTVVRCVKRSVVAIR